MTAAETKAPTIELPTSFLIDLERAVMARGGRQRGDEIHFRCPLEGHEDRTPSASYNMRIYAWNCYACNVGGGAYDLADRLGVERPPVKPPAPRIVQPRKIVAIYDYVDPDGEILYQSLRL